MYVKPLLGFESVTLFFVNQSNNTEIFAIAAGDGGDEEEIKRLEKESFTKELYFPDDQIVIFPSSIGITGEMHRLKA